MTATTSPAESSKWHRLRIKVGTLSMGNISYFLRTAARDDSYRDRRSALTAKYGVLVNRDEAIAAVAAERGLVPRDFRASLAPEASIHEKLWYVSEVDIEQMLIDDCVWIVFPDGLVTRGIPVGNPIHSPSLPDQLR